MSRPPSERNEMLFAPIVAPSGMFTCNYNAMSVYVPPSPDETPYSPELWGPIESPSMVYNPMPVRVRQNVVDIVPIDHQEKFLDEYQRAGMHNLFDRREFDEYARTLFEKLIPSLAQNKHDVILFPLRGSRQPGILAKVVAGLPDVCLVIFNYTYATRPAQQSLIRSELLEQLRHRLPEKQSVSLGVVDTAKGGYGSRHLAQLLSSLHSDHFSSQVWTVQFHLLHARDGVPRLAHEIPKFGHAKLTFSWPNFHEVESLLVEDWAEGIGLAVKETRGYYELKRCVEPGRLLCRDEDTVQVIESEELCNTVTALAADALNRLMLDHPSVEYIKDVCDLDQGEDAREVDG